VVAAFPLDEETGPGSAEGSPMSPSPAPHPPPPPPPPPLLTVPLRVSHRLFRGDRIMHKRCEPRAGERAHCSLPPLSGPAGEGPCTKPRRLPGGGLLSFLSPPQNAI